MSLTAPARTRRAVFALAGLALLGIAAWFAGTRPAPRAPDAAPAPAHTAAADETTSTPAAVTTPGGAATASVPRVAATPLPAPGAPFDTTVVDLLARAEAGEAGAACRLSLELLRCRQLLAVRGLAESRREEAVEAETAGESNDAEYLLGQSDHLAAVDGRCRTIDAALIDRAPEFLREAALAGDREARLQYVDGRNLFPAHDFRYVTDPYFDRWRREAPRMLAELLADGEPQAAIWMAEGRGGGEGAIQGLLRDDVERAQVWVAVVDALYDDMTIVPVPVAPPSGERVDAVAATAAKWRQRWYGDRTVRFFERPVFELLPTLNPNAVDVGAGCGRTDAARAPTGATR